MRRFTTLWLGQLISTIGSAMTWFAFTLWAWDETGKVSALATIAFFAFLPTVLLSPVAGALVDRWRRQRARVIFLSDFATALGTLVIFLIATYGNLKIGHIYLVSIVVGCFTAFQYPAFAAAVTTMVPKKEYARAEGMLSSGRSLSGILAPIFAAALLGPIGLRGVMLIDLATFLFAFFTLLVIRIPPPEDTQTGRRSRGTLPQEIRFGFQYIREDRHLSALTVLFMPAFMCIAIGSTLIAPLVLAGTGASESALAAVQAAGAAGGIAGGALLSLWGGAKRQIHNVLIGGVGTCLLGILWLGFGNTILLWAIGGFLFAFFEPFVEGGNLAIWQSRVPQDVQGRVLASRYLLVQIPYVIGMLISGYLAEAFRISIVLILAGLAGTVVFTSGYLVSAVHTTD